MICILRYVLPSNACLLEFVIAIGFEMLACKVYKRGKKKEVICIKLHYIPSHHITLHYTLHITHYTLHITWHDLSLPCIALRCIALHYKHSITYLHTYLHYIHTYIHTYIPRVMCTWLYMWYVYVYTCICTIQHTIHSVCCMVNDIWYAIHGTHMIYIYYIPNKYICIYTPNIYMCIYSVYKYIYIYNNIHIIYSDIYI